MKQFIRVLKFELGNYYKNKSFIITTIIIALLAIGLVSVPTMIPGLLPNSTAGADVESDVESDVASDVENDDVDTSYGIYDPDEVVTEAFLSSYGMGYQWESYQSEAALKEAVEAEDIEGGFIITGPMSYTYIVINNSLYDSTQAMFDELLLDHYQTQYLTEKGLTSEEIEEFQQTAVVSETEILGKDSANNYWYTYVLIFVTYFLIIFYGQMIATSVTTEKSNRAIEILVTSVNSSSLIFGKVIAGAIAGVVQVGIILGSAFGTYHIFRENWGYALDFLFHVPGQVWAIYATFGLLGYLLYAFIYGTLGALVSKTEDISKSSSFITLIYIFSFFISIFGMNLPDSLLIKVCSFIPFTSSNAMLVRASMGNVALWEILISFIILLLSCLGIGYLAAKLFRFGTLMYGNPIKLTTALKKMRHTD